MTFPRALSKDYSTTHYLAFQSLPLYPTKQTSRYLLQQEAVKKGLVEYYIYNTKVTTNNK